MTAVSDVDVANMALDILSEGQIGSLEEDNKPARILNRWYEVVREAELMKNIWAFATVFPDEADAADTGLSGQFQFFYEVPDDFLRPVFLTRDGFPTGVPVNYTLWGDGIRTDFEGPLSMPYVANVTDPGDWNALFTIAMATALALPLAYSLAGKASLVPLVQGAYNTAISDARRLNAIMKLGRTPVSGWPAQRGDFRYQRP